MKPRFLLLLLFVFGVLSVPSVRANPDSTMVGTWLGIADQQVSFSMTFDLVDGEFTGTVDSPDSGLFDRPLTEMTLEDRKVTMKFDVGEGLILIIYGMIQEDGTVTGSYDMGESYGTFEMSKEES